MRDEAAVSWGQGRIDLFWRADDDALWHRAFEAPPGATRSRWAGRSPRDRP